MNYFDFNHTLSGIWGEDEEEKYKLVKEMTGAGESLQKALSNAYYCGRHKNSEDTFKLRNDVDWNKYTDAKYCFDDTVYHILSTNGEKVLYRICVYYYRDNVYYYDKDREAALKRSPRGRWYFRVRNANKNRLYLDDFELSVENCL